MTWNSPGPEKMAAEKGRKAAAAGKPCAPSDAWSVPLRKVYRDAYNLEKERLDGNLSRSY